MNSSHVGQASGLPDAGPAGAVQSVSSASLPQNFPVERATGKRPSPAGSKADSTSALRTVLSLLAVLAAAGLFAASLKLPLWHLKMEAPQYREQEALRIRVYPGHMAGDIQELKTLNQYIGVHVPEHLPQWQWLPPALLVAAGLGLVSTFLPRRARSRGLLASAVLLSVALVASAATAQWQMHQIGHERDHHAALKGVPDFTPPLFGSEKVANFEITTGLGAGAFLIGIGLALQLGAAFLSRTCSSGRESAPCYCQKDQSRLMSTATGLK